MYLTNISVQGPGLKGWTHRWLLRPVSGTTSLLLLLASLIASALFQLSAASLLPPKYFADGNGIASLVQQSHDFHIDLRAVLGGGGGSFRNVAWLYHQLGFGYMSPPTAGMVIWLLTAFMAVTAAASRPQRWTVLGLAVTSLWIAVMAIYLGQYSKELPAVCAVWLATFLLGTRRWGLALAVATLAVYAIAFRPYWLLVAAVWPLLIWLTKSRPTARDVVITLILLSCSISLAYHLSSGGYLSNVRAGLNLNRIGDPGAITIIRNIFTTPSVLSDVANTVVGWLRIVLPIELLTYGGVLHVGGFVLQTMTSLVMLLTIAEGRGGRGVNGKERWRENQSLKLVGLWMAFTFVQGIFEPDFGSAIKHSTAMLPLVVRVSKSLGIREARGQVQVP